MRDAHRRAGSGPGRGPGDVPRQWHPRNDETEAAVLGEVFAGQRPGPLMTAIKSLTGHTLGGSGLLSLVMGILAALGARCRRCTD
ncbi:hypothetical protein NKH77_47965 [Streptomyces sp. M19]